MENRWFVIINPTSGNGAAKKKWPLIYKDLIKQKVSFDFYFTNYEKHSYQLIKQALDKGYKNLVCVGGDGTLHNMVNGVLRLKPNNINEIKICIIPIGTGNDWIKTFHTSKNYKIAIKTIIAGKTIAQDIGKITLEKNKKVVYFNNLAGIGFDGYVVHKVKSFKHFGFLAYLTGALVSLTSYKKVDLEISFNNTVLKENTLMFLIGICKFSGGGMQLTKNPNPTDGLFDISHIYDLKLGTLLKNLPNLFNGKITELDIVHTYKASEIKIKLLEPEKTYIQADGEVIGIGDFTVKMLPKKLHFVIP